VQDLHCGIQRAPDVCPFPRRCVPEIRGPEQSRQVVTISESLWIVSCLLAPNTENIASAEALTTSSRFCFLCFLTSMTPAVPVAFRPPPSCFIWAVTSHLLPPHSEPTFSSVCIPLATTLAPSRELSSHPAHRPAAASSTRSDLCEDFSTSGSSHTPSRPSPSPCSRSPSSRLSIASQASSNPGQFENVQLFTRRCRRPPRLRPRLLDHQRSHVVCRARQADRRYADTRPVDSIE